MDEERILDLLRRIRDFLDHEAAMEWIEDIDKAAELVAEIDEVLNRE